MKLTSYRMTRLLADRAFLVCALSAMGAGVSALAQTNPVFVPGNIVVSRSVYLNDAAAVVPGVTQLPPGCSPFPVAGSCVLAGFNGSYPTVFNNVTNNLDTSFGITSPIYLDQMSTSGAILNTVTVPFFTTNTTADQLVTSFSSKSEEGLHLSTDGTMLSFMDYIAPANVVDVSNSNTPAVIDPTNPVVGSYYRAVATVNAQGQFSFTKTNAYSGNNGRAAIYVNTGGNNFFYTVGNAGNGSNPEPKEVVEGAGVQLIVPASLPEASQTPSLPTPVASFDVSQVLAGARNPDKTGKDDNFRGMTLYNGVLYVTKGSGSNGVNTVYFVDTTGTACPTTGIGLPVPGAPLPNASTAAAITASYSSSTGLANNMCILAGFPTIVNKNASASALIFFPFGLWFANSTTLYVADEGDGATTYNATTNTYTDAAGQTTPHNPGGLQKWVFNGSTWQLAYTLTNGLNLGVPYSVPTPTSGPNAGIPYPTGINGTVATNGTGLPFAPATDGLREIIGVVEGSKLAQTVAIFAVSSTVSGNGDTGADPNKIYVITDRLTNTSPAVAAQETFTVFRNAQSGEVLRGISFTPGTPVTSN
jgi:hypothetical protein